MDGYKLTISGLVRRRERLAGDIIKKRRELNAMRRDLDALDSTLILFGYDSPKEIKPVIAYPRLFKRNQLSRLVRDIGGDDTAQITREVIERMGWADTPDLYERVYKKVRYALWAKNRVIVKKEVLNQ